MARPHSSDAPRIAALADATATTMAHAAQALAGAGDHETAEAFRGMARHNRIVALRLRILRGLAAHPIGLARIS